MKILIAFFLILFCFNSCHSDDGKIYTYKLKNNSGEGIRVVAFNSSNLYRGPVTTLIDDDEEIVKHYKSDPPLYPNGYSYVGFFQGDSIIVIYGNEKRQIVVEETCEGSERNPLNFCLYSEQEEVFTFTEEDYENATPCEGECN